jgi:uncharacterized protein with GYD domain
MSFVSLPTELLLPSDSTAPAAAMLSLASLGYVRPKTLRAFTASEMEAIVGKIIPSA